MDALTQGPLTLRRGEVGRYSYVDGCRLWMAGRGVRRPSAVRLALLRVRCWIGAMRYRMGQA